MGYFSQAIRIPTDWLGSWQTDFSFNYITYADTVKNERILELCVEFEQPICLVGLAGTGKTAAVQKYLSERDPEFYSDSVIDVNFYTEHRDINMQLKALLINALGEFLGLHQVRK